MAVDRGRITKESSPLTGTSLGLCFAFISTLSLRCILAWIFFMLAASK
jgi:hypothetical protein